MIFKRLVQYKRYTVIFAVAALCICAMIVAVCNKASMQMMQTTASPEESSEISSANGVRRTNILLLGKDDEAGLCDVMMIASICGDNACVVQIPRDTYAEYTDKSYKKLNGAYAALGGAKAVVSFLEDTMGISIDGYLCIGLDSLGKIVDAVGGVEINVPRDMYYSDPEQGLVVNIKKGVNHLDGKTAQEFVRYRSGYADGDLGRIDAQKLFIAAMFKKLSGGFSPLTALKLAEILDEVETDVTVSGLLSLCENALRLKKDNVILLTLPGEQAVASRSGASYYALCKSSCADVTKSYLGGGEDFDRYGLFENRDYQSFMEIYKGNSKITPVTVEELSH